MGTHLWSLKSNLQYFSPASKCLAPKLSLPGRPGRPTTLKSSKMPCETTANSCSSTPTTSVLCSLLRSEPPSVENVGFVFTNNDLKEIRDEILNNKVAAPARAGAISPIDVIVPAQNTGMGPEKTSFFQALSIQTKIAR